MSKSFYLLTVLASIAASGGCSSLQVVFGSLADPWSGDERPAIAGGLAANAGQRAGVTSHDLDCRLLPASDATRARDHFDSAMRYVREGDETRALAELTEAVGLDPTDARAWLWLARMHLQFGNTLAAIAESTEAIRLDPSGGSPYRTRAIARRRQGDLDGSLNDLNRAADLMPYDPGVFYSRAITYWRRGKAERALEDLDRSLALEPDTVDVVANRCALRRDMGEVAGAIEDASHLVELRPADPTGYFLRGMLYYDDGDMARALHEFERVLSLDPAHIEALLAAGAARARRGESDEALPCLSAAIRLAPDDPRPYAVRSRVLAARGDVESAARARSRAEELERPKTVAEFGFGKDSPEIVIPLSVGGSELPLLLDTGCSMLLLDESLRPTLGEKRGTVVCNAFGMRFECDTYSAPPIKIGSEEVGGVEMVAVCDLSKANEVTHCPILAIGGIDIVCRFAVQIDFDAGSVRFLRATSGEHPEWGSGFALVSDRGLAAVATELAGSQRRFLLDTGMGGTGMLTADTFDALVCRDGLATGQTMARTLAGDRSWTAARVPEFRLGGISHRGLIFCRGPHCVLGMDYLARFVVTMDFPHWRLYLRKGAEFARPDELGMLGLCPVYREGRLIVLYVNDGTPASEAGIQPGDELTRIDGSPVQSIPREELFTRETPVPGDEVKLEIRRGDDTFEVTLVTRRRL